MNTKGARQADPDHWRKLKVYARLSQHFRDEACKKDYINLMSSLISSYAKTLAFTEFCEQRNAAFLNRCAVELLSCTAKSINILESIQKVDLTMSLWS